MLSIAALSHPENANVAGSETSQQEAGTSNAQKRGALDYTGGDNPSGISQTLTGYTSSSISFFAKGQKQEESIYSATVPIKELFVVVSINVHSL